MQKWEYCAVFPVTVKGGWLGTSIMGKQGGYLEYLRPTGATHVKIGNHPNDIAKTIGNLGSEGWEMVGSGVNIIGAITGTIGHQAIYFKRPVEE